MGNYLTFDGISTADYGVEISGEGVFDAPARVYEMIEIPGRNGALAIDQGRYENAVVTYPAYNYEADLSTFAQRLSDLRNALGSRTGYKRLTDTFHPDEYRLGIFKSGLEVKPVKYNTASEFDITFDCKPQRYLTSGETQVDVTSAAHQVRSGNPIYFNYDGYTTVNALTGSSYINFNYGTGTKSPYNPWTFPTFDTVAVELNGTVSSASLGDDYYGCEVDFLANTVKSNAFVYTFDGSESITYNAQLKQFKTTITVPSGFSNPGCTHYQTAQSATQNHRMAFSLLGTSLTVTWRDDDYFSAALMQMALDSWNDNGTPMQIGGTTAAGTASSITVSPALSYATGMNELNNTHYYPNLTFFLDITGEVTLTNPTNFDSKPLLSITGTGTLYVGDATIVVSGNGDQMWLDCELCEAWSESGGTLVNRNSDVAMSGADFPTLKPGGNVITSIGGAFTSILVTPRWWKL